MTPTGQASGGRPVLGFGVGPLGDGVDLRPVDARLGQRASQQRQEAVLQSLGRQRSPGSQEGSLVAGHCRRR